MIARAREDIVGCLALVPVGAGVVELSKMTVAAAARGRGIGRTLLLAAIDHARAMGATAVSLGTSTTLPHAVRLYESAGFLHTDTAPPSTSQYQRANVYMELQLH